MTLGAKGIKSLLCSILHTFYRQKVQVTLQCAHAVSILTRVIAIGESSSRLGVISRGPPLSLLDMLLAT
jgi:hypothetical protein